jgi:phosphate acetyltransferase
MLATWPRWAAATRFRLIEPTLVGPVERLRNAAEQVGLQFENFEIVGAARSHDSATRAVALVAAGRVDALMKGSLHTDELMGAVVSPHGGIRTERRVGHCFIMDVPGYQNPSLSPTRAINIAPDLNAKADIFQNAIDLARATGVLDLPQKAVQHFSAPKEGPKRRPRATSNRYWSSGCRCAGKIGSSMRRW